MDLIVTGKNDYEVVFDPLKIQPDACFKNFVENTVDVSANFLEKLFPLDKNKSSRFKKWRGKIDKL
jgi:hypothetical protein